MENGLDFRQLEAFCAIMEWGNFSEAAKHLFITQPTISSHIQSLERLLHTRLIDRTTKPVTFTDDGMRFYEYARSLLRLREKAMIEFDSAGQSTVHFGASSIPSAYILPELISAYRESFPETVFCIIQADSSAILSQIQSGVIDVGITGIPFSDEHCVCKAICRDEMVLAAPATPRFLKLKEAGAPLTELLREPYLMREDGSGTKKEAEQFLESLGLSSASLNSLVRINDLEAIKQSIIYGLGVSILSRRVTAESERAGRMTVFPLASGGVYRSYYLIYRKSKIQDPKLLRFIEFVEGYYK